MNLLVLRLKEDAKLPTKAHSGDAGLDLYSQEHIVLSLSDSDCVVKIPTGIALGIPDGYFGLICDRSGMGLKGIKVFGGVADGTYTGEIFVCLGKIKTEIKDDKCQGDRFHVIKKGDKIAQIVILPVPNIHVVEVYSLDETERGWKGFNSSGS